MNAQFVQTGGELEFSEKENLQSVFRITAGPHLIELVREI